VTEPGTEVTTEVGQGRRWAGGDGGGRIIDAMRLFVVTLAAGAMALALAQTRNTADLILINGRVFTADARSPWAEAVAVRGNRIVEVGTNAAVRQRAESGARIIDAGGRVVIPGINDAHTHVGARPPGTVLKLADDPTLDDVIAAVRTAASSPADQWIYGTIGARVLLDPQATRLVLDEAAPGRRVKLAAWTGHGNILSTAALRALGIGDRDPDPPFGRYGRLPDGTTSGLLEEYADVRANRRMTALAGRTAVIESLQRLANEAIGYGVTTIQAMAASVPAADLQSMLGEASAPIRWRVIRFPVALRQQDDRESLAPLPRQPSTLVTISGTKWILDGTPIERLAAMNDAYADRSGWTGRLNLSTPDIDAALRRALDGGDEPMFHIVGDRGIDVLFSAMERLAGPERWRPLRVRIEHGEFLTASRIARAKRLGIINVQNPSHFTIRDEMRARFGVERAEMAQAVKSLVEAGVPVALGSDGPMNPFLNMMFAITHPNNPREALTREQVVAAYTTGSAYAEFAEHDKGRIAAGMLADLAVLTQDIFTVAADRLPATLSALTIVNGRIVRNTLQ
jgi:predicted amidohydrolase YtcJ